MKKYLLFINFLLGIFWSQAQLSINESFETSALPSGWSYNPTSIGWVNSNVSPLNGVRSLRKSISATSTTPNPFVEFVSKAYTNSNGKEVQINIKSRAHRFSDRVINGNLSYYYTINDGETWVQIGNTIIFTESFDPNQDQASDKINETSIIISEGDIPIGSTFKFKSTTRAELLADGTQNNFYIYFDDLIISQVSEALPDCVNVLTPINQMQNFNVDGIINWEAVPGADGYKISLGTSNGNYDLLNAVDLGNVISYRYNQNLEPSTLYYLKIEAYNGAGSSENCVEIEFKTVATPSNDDIHNAIEIVPNNTLFCNGGTRGTFENASRSIQNLDCSTSANPNNDVWYKFVATSKRHVVRVSPVDNGVSDFYFSFYTGDVNNLQTLACVDEEHAILDDLIIGNTYYIRLFTYSNNATNSSFDICLSTASIEPVNDSKENAILIEDTNFDGLFNTSGYRNRTNMTSNDLIDVCSMYAEINLEGVNLSSSNLSDDGIWFKFKGNGKNYSVRTISDENWDARLDVYRSLTDAEKIANPNHANSLTCVGTKGAQVTDFTHTVNIENSIADVDYYINIANYLSNTKHPTGIINLIVNTESDLDVVDVNNQSLKIYPNPFTDKILINSSNIKEVKIFTLDGKIALTSDKNELKVNHLKKGVYLIQVTDNVGNITMKKLLKN